MIYIDLTNIMVALLQMQLVVIKYSPNRPALINVAYQLHLSKIP